MNQPSNDKQPPETLEVQSDLPPNREIETSLKAAKIRDSVEYKVSFVGPRRWKIEILRGSIESVRKALQKAMGLKLVD